MDEEKKVDSELGLENVNSKLDLIHESIDGVEEALDLLKEKDENNVSSRGVENCLFCKIVRGEVSSEKVFENNNFIGILDIKPISSGHVLIISKRHFRNILDFPNTYGPELLAVIKKVSLDLINRKKANGVNVVINNEPCSGQTVFHTHVHIIPRKEGDNVNGFSRSII